MLHPSLCPCGLTWMILLKVSWLLPNLEFCGERGPIGGFGESFYNVNACFNGNGNNLKVVFCSSVRGEVSSSLWYMFHDGLTFLDPVYAEYVMWIWSVTLPLLYVVPYLLTPLFGFLYWSWYTNTHNLKGIFWFRYFSLWDDKLFNFDLAHFVLYGSPQNRSSVIHGMLMMQDMLWTVGMLTEVASLWKLPRE